MLGYFLGDHFMVTPLVSGRYLFACLARGVWLDSGYILRQSTRLLGEMASGICRCFQHLAWSVSGYMPMRQSTRHLEVFFGVFLWPRVSGSRLFFPEEYEYAVFLGGYFGSCRIQRFLVRQWVHVIVSL